LDLLNIYGVRGSATVTLGGNKTLQGATLTDGQFTFELHKTDSTFRVVGAAVQTATNKAGKFGFDLHFNATDIGTHYFVVLEKNAGKTVNGITYSAAQYYITVVVADNGKGGITVTTSITDGVQVVKEMNFVNTYAVTGTYDIMLEAHKTLEGKTLAAGEFSFALYHANKNFEIYAGALQNVANGADGSVRFSGLTIREAGKYYFVVAENKADAIEKVTYDESVYHITVEIVDDGKGGLKLKDMKIVKILGENSETVNAITFVNTYTPDPNALPLDFEVNKTVTNLGTEVIGPEGFIFQLENMTVGGILTAVSDENGKAVFTLTFTEDDIGKVYTYKLTEVNDGREHVTYSDVAYNITVAISLNENNELVATITNNGAEVQKIVADFENIYDYTPEPDKTGDPGLVLWTAMLAVSGLGGMVTMKTFGKKKDEE
jgi:pilin isopeptide linkage protein